MDGCRHQPTISGHTRAIRAPLMRTGMPAYQRLRPGPQERTYGPRHMTPRPPYTHYVWGCVPLMRTRHAIMRGIIVRSRREPPGTRAAGPRYSAPGAYAAL